MTWRYRPGTCKRRSKYIVNYTKDIKSWNRQENKIDSATGLRKVKGNNHFFGYFWDCLSSASSLFVGFFLAGFFPLGVEANFFLLRTVLVSLSSSRLQKLAPKFLITEAERVGGVTVQPRQSFLVQRGSLNPFLWFAILLLRLMVGSSRISERLFSVLFPAGIWTKDQKMRPSCGVAIQVEYLENHDQ